MPKYRITERLEIEKEVYIDIEANSENKAYELAQDTIWEDWENYTEGNSDITSQLQSITTIEMENKENA